MDRIIATTAPLEKTIDTGFDSLNEILEGYSEYSSFIVVTSRNENNINNSTFASLKLIAAERLHGLLTGYSQRGEAEADCARIAYNPIFPLSQSDNTIRHSVGCNVK